MPPYVFPTTPYVFPRFPTDGGNPAADGFIDVVQYGADPTGVADSTVAIQNAIFLNREPSHVPGKKTLFFRNGTYKLGLGLNGNRRGIIERRFANAASGNVARWRGGLRIQGESEDGTILRLGDNLLTDPNNPRFVIYFASYQIPESSPQNTLHAEWESIGNEGYDNKLADLTIHLGTGNIGAVGVNVMMHNIGSVRRVTVDGRGNGTSSTFGYAGLSTERQGTGPNHLNRITVKGCRYGFRIAATMYGQGIEHLKLEGQSVAGIDVNANVLAVRGLVSNNSVPVVNMHSDQLNHFAAADQPYWAGSAGQSHGGTHFYESNATGNLPAFTLIDAVLTGTGAASSLAAIRNNTPGGKMFLRNIQTTGYARAASETAGPVQNSAVNITEYASPPNQNQWGQTPVSMNLPINETPSNAYAPLASWRSVTFPTPGFPSGCIPNTNITAALQSAIDNCPPGVSLYFPPTAAVWFLTGTIRIRGNVRHILFNGAEFYAQASFSPVWRFEHTTPGPPVIMEYYIFENPGLTNFPNHTIATQRDVVLIDAFVGRINNTSGTLGTLYIDDAIVTAAFDFPQNMYARQFNADGGFGITKHVGGNLWIFYYKSEQGIVSMNGITGGKIEEIGSWHSGMQNNPGATPAYAISNADLSLAGVTFHEGDWGGGVWTNVVNETQTAGPAPTTRVLNRASCANRGGGKHITLFRSRFTPGVPIVLPPVYGTALVGATAHGASQADFIAALKANSGAVAPGGVDVTAIRVFGVMGNWASSDYTEARDASAAGRVAVISTKLNSLPAEVVAGTHDALLTNIGQGMATLAVKPIWIYWHECENDAINQSTQGKANYRAAFTRAAGIIRANCPGVRIAICYLGSTMPGNASWGPPEDFYPGDSVIDIVMSDHYDKHGTSDTNGIYWAVPGTPAATMAFMFSGAVWAKARGKPYMFGELGSARLQAEANGATRTAFWKTFVDYADAYEFTENIQGYLHYEPSNDHDNQSRPNWTIHHEPASMAQFARLAWLLGDPGPPSPPKRLRRQLVKSQAASRASRW